MKTAFNMRNHFRLMIEATGAISALLAIYSFFSIKPLPLITLTGDQINEGQSPHFDENADYAYGDDIEQNRCYIHFADNELNKIEKNSGRIVFVRLQINADGTFHAEEGHAWKGSGCKLRFANFSHLDDDEFLGFSYPFEKEEYFRHVVSPEITASFYDHIERRNMEYQSWPELVLPLKSKHNSEVNYCEAHCYSLEGAVKITALGASEGISAYQFEPIDVYRNSYLTSRYECRQSALSIGFEFLAPLYCNFM